MMYIEFVTDVSTSITTLYKKYGIHQRKEKKILFNYIFLFSLYSNLPGKVSSSYVTRHINTESIFKKNNLQNIR